MSEGKGFEVTDERDELGGWRGMDGIAFLVIGLVQSGL